MARYVWRPGVGLVEFHKAPPEARVHLQTDAGFDNMRAGDGTDLTSRSKWKRYMRENNLTLSADWKETWAKNQAKREKLVTGQADDPRRRETVRRVVYEMNSRDVKAHGERARERHAQFGKEGLVFRGD
jgi:hypothetical protein